MKITSNSLILDVKRGRNKLLKTVGWDSNEGKCVPVTITGYIVSAYGNDDGVSREFSVEVDSVVCEEPSDV